MTSPTVIQNLQPEKILVRGVNWLGDAVMTTPALERLREAKPNAHITLLTHEKLAGLWHHFPSLDAQLTFSERETIWSIGRRLRDHRFQIGLVLPNSPRSALELWFARIPQRIGYAGSWRSWILTKKISQEPNASAMRKRTISEINRLIRSPRPIPAQVSHRTNHHIYHYLQITAALGGNPELLTPRLVVTQQELDSMSRRVGIAGPGQNDRPLFGLNPGAEYGPAKRWPRERFVEAAVKLQRRTNCRWLVLGGNEDVKLAGGIAQEIQNAAPQKSPPGDAGGNAAVVNLTGATTLRELCAALKLCQVLLSNDTGPMHVAAALGTPVVVPFGSTSPELTGPGLPGDPRHRLLTSGVPCAPCFLRQCPIDFRCMDGISVESVVDSVLAVVAASPVERT